MSDILSSIKRYDSKEIIDLMEVNPDMQVEHFELEGGFRYVKIYDFLLHPERLIDFLKGFPTEDRTKSILNGNKDKLCTESTAPGFQQPIPHTYFYNTLSPTLFNVLKHYHMLKYTYKMCNWSYYTNCCYPNMPAYNQNYIPHTDPFSFAANIFLTDNEDSSTDLFKINLGDGKYVYRAKDLARHHEHWLAEKSRREEKNNSDELTKWYHWKGDDTYIMYHSIKADFNSVTMYKGDYYHALGYDAELNTDVRYSLVGVVN